MLKQLTQSPVQAQAQFVIDAGHRQIIFKTLVKAFVVLPVVAAVWLLQILSNQLWGSRSSYPSRNNSAFVRS